MDNNDERDYAEEEYNRNLLREVEEIGPDLYGSDNRLTCPNCDRQHERGVSCKTDEEHNRRIADENRESVVWWNFGHPSDLLTNYRTMDESAQEVENRLTPYDSNPYQDEGDNRPEPSLPVGYGDEWDGSSTNQSNEFFIGHSGYVTLLWQITNNPFEKYDPSKSYQTPAKDGSALYVWCNLQMSDSDAIRSIRETSKLLTQMDTNITSIHYISE